MRCWAYLIAFATPIGGRKQFGLLTDGVVDRLLYLVLTAAGGGL